MSSSETAGGGGGRAMAKPYLVMVSLRFIFLSLLSTILLAFTIGRAARIILLEGPSRALLFEDPSDSSMYDRPDYHEAGYGGPAGDQSQHERRGAMPEPVLLDGKEVPRTVYSSKNFDTPLVSTSSSMHIAKPKGGGSPEKSLGEGWQVCRNGEDCSAAAAKKEPEERDEEDDDEEEEEEEHLPAGQHLLVDIKNIDGTFLNSEERLARAMIDVVNQSRLTLLSYHCHSLIPMGVSCVGVLLESHISFHTWPDEGVITLDLFTCGSNPLVPVMPIIERLFAVPRKPLVSGEDVEPPGIVWSHKLRGFRGEDAHSRNPLARDLGHYMLEIMDFDMKKVVVSTQSEYQRIDVYEVIRPRFRDLLSYQRSLSGDGSYEALHPELYRPDRVLFLDGVMQSTLYGDESYHEALVHPGMFAHPNPKRVAIIGGGEGATLREVLKHGTVEKAVMIEIDEVMVNVAREHLPSWSDCSDVVGSADWCGDDERAEIICEDALAWFLDRFSDSGTKRAEGVEPFDIIIMDALDPQDDVPFAEALYNNDAFMRTLKNALSEEGVIIMQLGESSNSMDVEEDAGRDKNRARMIELLEKVGFESIHAYEEGHSGFLWPWSYLVAMKDHGSRALWYANAAQIEMEIHRRIRRSKSGAPLLRYFDSATMLSYQVPHKVVETVFCRKEPIPNECMYYRGHYVNLENAPVSSFDVKKSEAGESAGRGVFAKIDIKKDTMMAAEQSVKSIYFSPPAVENIVGYSELSPGKKLLRPLHAYMYGYGFPSNLVVSAMFQLHAVLSTEPKPIAS
mmetsp:Transcript_54572/g.163031  ORF Transcript_54572/g.163031 Transcript_54572/m.163031 type:complete len:791 (-) Transcript_54572:763-3135(-)